MKKVYLIAVVVAIFAGCATYLFAQEIIKKTSIKDAPKSTVLVANEEVKEGHRITADEVESLFRKKTIVKEDLPPNAITSYDQVIGQKTTRRVFVDEYLSGNSFQESDDDGAGLSFDLDTNEVAVSIKAKEEQGVDGYVQRGDIIDIVSFYEFDGDEDVKKADIDEAHKKYKIKGETVCEFTDLKVLKVARYEDLQSAEAEGREGVSTYVSITVKTTDEQAQKIYEMENNTDGNFKIILKAREDDNTDE